MALVAVRPFKALSEPANDWEPVPLKFTLPVLIVKPVPTIAAAFKPLVTTSEPAKELEPGPEETNSLEMVKSPVNEWEAKVSAMKRPDIWRLDDIEALAPKKVLPEIDAVPPTSSLVSRLLP